MKKRRAEERRAGEQRAESREERMKSGEWRARKREQ